jgi:putative ABC transport system permease protein
MFVDEARADIWIGPPETKLLQPGSRLPSGLRVRVAAMDGVAQVSELIYAGATIQRPWGGNEPVTLVGVDPITGLGGPWNVVAGDPSSLGHPGAMFFEDSKRDKLGGLNLGSLREVNGQQVRVAGFTWGLLPFGPPYAFAAIDTARELPDLTVVTRQQFHDSIVRSLLAEQLGMTFGTSTAFGLVIGFVIVALSMFSAVLDHLREFGTLKAVGVTNLSLATLLVVQSIAYALVGSLVGLGLVAVMAEAIRSANLSVILPWQLVALTPIVMMTLCVLASVLALGRVRKLDPGMVFR